MYTIELYRIENNAFVLLDELISFSEFEYSQEYNAIGMCEFTLNSQDIKASPNNITRHRTQVLIKKDGLPEWLGVVRNISGSRTSMGGQVTIQCLEYSSHLMNRYSGSYATYSGAGNTIYTDLVAEVQNRPNGNLLIVPGVVDTLPTMQDTFEYKPVIEILADQSDNINGFAFWFDPIIDVNKRLTGVSFNIVMSRGVIRTDLPPLRLNENVQSVSFSTQDDIENSITMLGGGTGEEVIAVSREDASSQIAFTRLEKVYKESDQSTLSFVEVLALRKLEENKAEKYHIDLELIPGSNAESVSIGDIVNIDIRDDGFVNFAGSAKVIALTKTVDINGVTTIIPRLRIYT